MHVHVLGICGTFMGSLALLAKEKGFRVTGCDQGVYPPMSTQLESNGIELIEGFDPEQLALAADLYVIGNVVSRGNPLMEEILNKGLPFISGPAFFAEHIVKDKWVLAAAGTHGKTTTSSMLSWILDYAGMKPGFLIGGVPKNFPCSARLGDSDFFVVEADEYDSAFFDKRSKFVHYRPRTFIFNNLEYDHADIFPDLEAIQTQFHHVIRTVPAQGQVIYPADYPAIAETLARGCWSEQLSYGESASAGVSYQLDEPDGSAFTVSLQGDSVSVKWNQTGVHNVNNAVAAMIAARHVGVTFEHSAQALAEFEGVKRRMDCLAETSRYAIYDDFAHHPTAIETTLDGLRKRVGDEHIVAIIEPRSNTMKMGVHENTLIQSAEIADQVIWAGLSGLEWLAPLVHRSGWPNHHYSDSLDGLLTELEQLLQAQQAVGKKVHFVFMSNGSFSGAHHKTVSHLASVDG